MKQKIEEYANVANILPRLVESYRKLDKALKIGTKESAIDIRLAKAEELEYWRQLDVMFPKLDLYQEFNDPPDPLDLWVNQDLKPLVIYFGKELPWDGKTDYLQAKPLEESKISLEEAASPTWQLKQLRSVN